MYRWIYHHLPGPRPVRIVLLAALLATVLILLFQLVFPYAAQFSPLGTANTVE
ncbi:hypothetical protein [Kocuria sp. NPDC057446]|uniref:hypothetical protein n=1 Tax=Kocuria sp. NPDC057446 TaxID=3346137 RepID=UPI00367C802A